MSTLSQLAVPPSFLCVYSFRNNLPALQLQGIVLSNSSNYFSLKLSWHLYENSFLFFIHYKCASATYNTGLPTMSPWHYALNLGHPGGWNVCVYFLMCTCMCTFASCVYVYMCVYMCVSICFICKYVCIFLHTHTFIYLGNPLLNA